MVQPEYVTDVAYARHFVPQSAPTMLRLVAALHGVAPPSGDDFDYCDLGMGAGDTLLTLAASNPGARFVGVDFLPEHVSFAGDLARKGRVGNARFLQKDFEDLGGADLPDFDFIVLHGVVAWVSAKKRAAAFAYARKKLKPGGLLYVSYNALPGWAALEPLRRLLRNEADALTGGVLERAGKAREAVRRMAAAGAAYFTNHPTAKAMLGVIEEASLPYIVHEYFHAHWQPFYFQEIARELEALGLEFLGQLPLPRNLRELSLPPALKEIGKSIGDRIAYETFKDFALNEAFRSDVYVNGAPVRAEASTQAFFEETPFGTLAAPSQIKREVRLAFYTLSYTGPIYDAILAAIAESPASARELAERPRLAGVGARRIGECLLNLALGGQVVPMRRSTPGAAGPRGFALASPYNREVLSQGLDGSGPRAFASPIAGTGVTLSLLESLCLDLLAEVNEPQRAARIEAFARGRPLPDTLGGKTLKSVDAVVRAVKKELEGFGPAASKLSALGILAPKLGS